MAGTLRKRATGIFSKPPSPPSLSTTVESQQPQRGQTLTLSSTDTESRVDILVEDMESSQSYNYNNFQEMNTHNVEPYLDDAHLSHISPEFAKMRPWDFELPKYEFYNENDSWFNDNVSFEDLTLQELQLCNDITLDEDVIATKIYFARPGKPKMVDVSPPPSIRSSRRSQSSEYSDHSHSRSSSYASHMDSKSVSDESEYEEESSLSTPDTPLSTHSKGFFSFQKRKPVAVYMHAPKKVAAT